MVNYVKQMLHHFNNLLLQTIRLVVLVSFSLSNKSLFTEKFNEKYSVTLVALSPAKDRDQTMQLNSERIDIDTCADAWFRSFQSHNSVHIQWNMPHKIL